MSFFSGISKVVTSTIGGQGGSYNPIKRILSSVPTTNGIGSAIGTIVGGKIKQGLLGLGNKAFPDLFNNKYFGPIANQIWGNLTYSQGDGIDAMMRRRDPVFNIDWTINMPLDPNINVHVEEINLSSTGIDTTPFQRAGRTVNLASMRTTGPLSITFYTDNQLACIEYIESWKSAVANPDGTFNYPAEYQQIIMVNVIDPAGVYVGSFFCANCFPSGPYQYGMGSANAERVRIIQEFSCDLVAFVPYSGTVRGIEQLTG